jgi:hypothetical protein
MRKGEASGLEATTSGVTGQRFQSILSSSRGTAVVLLENALQIVGGDVAGTRQSGQKWLNHAV